jgi:hypothetical protein
MAQTRHQQLGKNTAQGTLKNVVEESWINKITIRFFVAFGLSGCGSTIVSLLKVGQRFQFIE